MKEKEVCVSFKFLYKQENGIPVEIEQLRLKCGGIKVFKGGVYGVANYCQASVTVVCKGNRDIVN
jgi:hypothetical protein